MAFVKRTNRNNSLGISSGINFKRYEYGDF